jgi:hypothetical protein
MTLTAQQGILTTAQPPAAGVYIQAVIYAQATFEATAQWAIHDLPKGSVHLHAHARYHVRPPQTVSFRVSARYEMSAGTFSSAEVTFPATAHFGANAVPQASANFAVHAAYSFQGTEVQPPPVPPAAPNVAVTRAATI